VLLIALQGRLFFGLHQVTSEMASTKERKKEKEKKRKWLGNYGCFLSMNKQFRGKRYKLSFRPIHLLNSHTKNTQLNNKL
jgi:hypothetical protein